MENEEILRSIACIIAIDGTIAPQERQFWKRLCTRLGFSDEDAVKMLQQAQKEEGHVRIPQTPAKKTLLFTLLVQAAYSDGTISPQERKVLEDVASKIEMAHEDVEHIIETNVPPAPLPDSLDDVKEERSKKRMSLTSPLMLTMIATFGTILAAVITVAPQIWPTSTPTPTPSPTQALQISASAGTMVSMMIIKSVEVSQASPDDNKWDLMTEPDLQVEIQNLTSGQKQITNIQNDTLTALFNTQMVRVAEDDTLQIIVYDVDRAGNDIIGKLTQRITSEILTQKTVNWNFDQVLSFQVEFQAINK